MNLMDLLESAGGTDSVKNMSSQLGLGGADGDFGIDDVPDPTRKFF